ncbi:hypothetical protein FUAX_46290 (plasmid) [Fulvitalea axinellae]|uniref:JmjC domain-containing protein n=1 Tax=Fulvitalea axinellae TaxID=1182444 RepID=A0AAU9CZ09_9BACT|nr:hypothetical protein FUAX_46290 [Fulvitalea axinellae]
MSISFKPLTVEHDISKEEFQRKYMEPSRPVVLRNLSKKWDAREKWNWEYLKNRVGDMTVPLYDGSKVDASKKVNEPASHMAFSEYLDLIQREPTDLRIFLFNIFQYVPDLCADFGSPELMDGFLDKYPMMFFGGAGSSVFIHFDIDMSHVFHTQFQGRKKALLFTPDSSKKLYHVPLSVHNIEDIDMENPDFDKYPALKGLNGLEATLLPGDTLYMPPGWWHFMKYLDGGFGLSQRAFDPSYLCRLHGLFNLTVVRHTDNLGRKLFGPKWIKFKENLAMRRSIA